MKNMRGFTLGEMLIVMVIAGILGLTAVSGWHRWQQQRLLNEGARQVQHFLMRLRSEANWHNEPRLLWLLPTGAGCLGSGAIERACQPGNRLSLSGPGKGVRLVSLTEGAGFYGRRSVAKPGRVIIASPTGERHILISSRGRVRICRPEEERCP